MDPPRARLQGASGVTSPLAGVYPKQETHMPSPVHARRGSNAAIVAFGVLTFGGFAALAIDIGFLSSAKGQLQAVSDATAAAAAWHLDGTAAGMTAAEAEAFNIAALNEVWGESVTLAEEDVELGVWDFDNSTFTVSDVPAQVNAVRISPDLNAIPTFFAGLAFGQQVMSTSAVSIAVGQIVPPPAGEVPCYLPLAIPSCHFENSTNDDIQDITFVLSPSGIDNTGWARIGSSPNASFIRDQIGNCEQSGNAVVDQTVYLQGGAVNSALQDIAAEINAGGNGTWNEELWGAKPDLVTQSAISAAAHTAGYVFEAPILVIDVPDEYCTTGGAWNGSAPIKGFVWAAVYDVRHQGAAASQNIKMRVDLTTLREIGVDGGGEIDTPVVAPPGGESSIVH